MNTPNSAAPDSINRLESELRHAHVALLNASDALHGVGLHNEAVAADGSAARIRGSINPPFAPAPQPAAPDWIEQAAREIRSVINLDSFVVEPFNELLDRTLAAIIRRHASAPLAGVEEALTSLMKKREITVNQMGPKYTAAQAAWCDGISYAVKKIRAALAEQQPAAAPAGVEEVARLMAHEYANTIAPLGSDSGDWERIIRILVPLVIKYVPDAILLFVAEQMGEDAARKRQQIDSKTN